MRIVFRGKQVTNPVARVGLSLVGFLIMVIVAAVILFVILPLAGITLAITLGVLMAFAAGFVIWMWVVRIILKRRAARDRQLEDNHQSEEVR